MAKNNLTKSSSQDTKSQPSVPLSATFLHSTTHNFVSPLPPPETLEAYARLLPGITERMLVSFEKEGEHRRANDRFQQEIVREYHQNQARLVFRGQLLGFAIALVGLVVAFLLGWTGKQITASIIGGIDIVGLVSVFLYQRHKKSTNESLKQ